MALRARAYLPMGNQPRLPERGAMAAKKDKENLSRIGFRSRELFDSLAAGGLEKGLCNSILPASPRRSALGALAGRGLGEIRLELEPGADPAGGDGQQDPRWRVELVKLKFGAQEDVLRQRYINAAANRETVQHLRIRVEAPIKSGLPAYIAAWCWDYTVVREPATEMDIFAMPIANPTNP